MHLKSFSAATRDDALALMHIELGPDAIILSEEPLDNGFEIRAAIEHQSAQTEHLELDLTPQTSASQKVDRFNTLCAHLLRNGAPPDFAERLSDSALALSGVEQDEETALGMAFEDILRFSPCSIGLERDIILVGPPGAGKTSIAAKQTLQAHKQGKDVDPISADLDMVAADAKLAAYLQSRRRDIACALTPRALLKLAKRRAQQNRRFIIDAPSVNPFDTLDLARFFTLIARLDAEPILVLSAEGHVEDLRDIAMAFADRGVTRIIISKLDVVRKPANILAALACTPLKLAMVSNSPFMDVPLHPANPNIIAKLLFDTQFAEKNLKGVA